jgi:hypothetical protein
MDFCGIDQAGMLPVQFDVTGCPDTIARSRGAIPIEMRLVW